MSGIAKPHIKFTSAVTADQIKLVPIEHIVSMEKIDIGQLPNQPANTAKYLIVFNLVYPNSQSKVVEINFASSAARNSSYTTAETAIALNVA